MSPTGCQPEYLDYADLKVGDVVEIHVLVADHIGWEWERREVIGVDRRGSEHGPLALVVRFRDPSDGREYDIDALKPRKERRLIRRPHTTYLIRTVEHVEGLYRVEAESAEAARRQFEADPRHWGEQVNYSAFDIEVQGVEELAR